MTLLQQLEFLPQNKISRPLANLEITPATAIQLAMDRLPQDRRKPLYTKLGVTSRLEAIAKISYAIAMYNNLPVDFTTSQDLGTYDDLPTGVTNV